MKENNIYLKWKSHHQNYHHPKLKGLQLAGWESHLHALSEATSTKQQGQRKNTDVLQQFEQMPTVHH